ncbi:macrolide family glycosyltransferase [Mycolicibacterium sp. 120270]|uniref:macrolide family glycosyltransferase n=1 Tax=Mycolicibacterium sp. 120270 TaxID=3090600 RepID=UPI00299F13E0|nr:macrolide family glycosyltransferase [Mycolicibacterium sp. 120270]MDX1885454.1 glycosyltransferase [Mycolicibacterium sp. 120270]
MHIAVVAASAPSHMHPHLAAVRELVERGHRVSYVVSGHLAELAASTGADVVSCTSVLPGAPGAPPNWPADDVAGMRLFLDEAIHVLPQLHAALDRDRPDVVVYDIGGMAGPVAAARWAVPAVQVSPSMVAWETYHEDMADVLAPMLASDGYRDYRAAFDDWLAQVGSTLTFEEVTGEPRRSLVMIPRVMQPHADRVGDRYRFVGPCIDPRREDPGDWVPPRGDGPLALLAFGTSYTDRIDVYRNVIEGLDGAGWRLVIATGKVSADEFGVVPDWVQLRATVPQPAVLRVADAFITHAGMGSCTEALWYAVPTVAVPQAVDQPLNAALLETLGVGRHLTDDPPAPDDLRDATVFVATDPDVRVRINAIRDELHAVGGPAHAADAVEDVAAGRW